MDDLTFFKSSRSCEAHCVEIAFRGPSRCDLQHCIEVGTAGGGVVVRDSKDVTGPTLGFTNAAWSGFVGGIRAGDFG